MTFNEKELEIMLILMKYSFEEVSEVYQKINIIVARNLVKGEEKI